MSDKEESDKEELEPEELEPAGRIVMRIEGDFWVGYCYFCKSLPNLHDTILVDSIAMAAVRNNPDCKLRFQNLLRDAVAGVIEDVTGTRPAFRDWQEAAEHERSGNA